MEPRSKEKRIILSLERKSLPSQDISTAFFEASPLREGSKRNFLGQGEARNRASFVSNPTINTPLFNGTRSSQIEANVLKGIVIVIGLAAAVYYLGAALLSVLFTGNILEIFVKLAALAFVLWIAFMTLRP